MNSLILAHLICIYLAHFSLQKSLQNENYLEISEDALKKDISDVLDTTEIELDDDSEEVKEYDARTYTEFRLVSMLVNKIILDSIKEGKKYNQNSRTNRHRRRKQDQRSRLNTSNDGEMIPYPRVGR